MLQYIVVDYSMSYVSFFYKQFTSLCHILLRNAYATHMHSPEPDICYGPESVCLLVCLLIKMAKFIITQLVLRCSNGRAKYTYGMKKIRFSTITRHILEKVQDST